jgi:hypothetical protein
MCVRMREVGAAPRQMSACRLRGRAGEGRQSGVATA